VVNRRINAVPIVDDEKLVGIISEGDLLRRAELGTERKPSRWLQLLVLWRR
jgi:CBS domain-containing protein